jgi:endonuclease/exonuclease/phosphatase family metal-dependent hydrolase
MPACTIESIRIPAFALAVLACSMNLAQAGPPPTHRLTVASLNLYNRPWKRALRTYAAIEHFRRTRPDVIALQEVSTGWWLPGNPAEEIAEALGMHCTPIAWHETNFGIFKTGLAILTREPLQEPARYHEFEQLPFWDGKGFIVARILTPAGPVRFINVHLASTNDGQLRAKEWRQLGAFISKEGPSTAPTVLAGDFNTGPSDSSLIEFMRASGASHSNQSSGNLAALRSWAPWPYFGKGSCGDANQPVSELLDYVFAIAAAGRPAPRFTDNRIFDSIDVPVSTAISDHCAISARIDW